MRRLLAQDKQATVINYDTDGAEHSPLWRRKFISTLAMYLLLVVGSMMRLTWRGACSTPVCSLHLLCASERGFLYAWVATPRPPFTARPLQSGLTATSPGVVILPCYRLERASVPGRKLLCVLDSILSRGVWVLVATSVFIMVLGWTRPAFLNGWYAYPEAVFPPAA
jgi:hypothetical protein